MPLILSHMTAIRCWLSGCFDASLGGPFIRPRHRPSGCVRIEQVASGFALDRLGISYGEAFAFGNLYPFDPLDYKPRARAVSELRRRLPLPPDEELHFLVPGKAAFNEIQHATCHASSTPLPAGALVRVDGGLMVCSPEFAFLQVAKETPTKQLARIGSELCALYRRAPDGSVTYGRVLPTTTKRALDAFLQRCKGREGVVAARKGLRYVVEAAASPMELGVAHALCLPPRMGGYGLPWPLLNYRVDVPKAKRSLVEKSYYLCDLFWPEAMLDLEYDSDQEHTGSTRIAADSDRRNDLHVLGIEVVTATREQVGSDAGLDRLARQIASQLGVRIRCERVQQQSRGAGIRRVL